MSCLLLFFFASCSEDNNLEKRMNKIKAIGDNDPELALSMLDSAKTLVNNSSEHTRMKFELLSLRLNDKAYKIPKSDLLSKQVVEYFKEHGSSQEQQEAYYYNGSVYRDLNDTPRAMENFLKSIEIGENNKHCDSLMLRNAYSNMEYLFYGVQDYKNELVYAKKEYKLSKELNNLGLLSIIHVAMSYTNLDSTMQAKQVLEEAFLYTKQHKDIDRDDLYTLIFRFSFLKDKAKATYCLNRLKAMPYKQPDPSDLIALAEYYSLTNQTDSVIRCYKEIFTRNPNYSNMYDASKALFRIYKKLGDNNEALKYAQIYVNISDTLDLGKRQELAATVNNQYQYHLDSNKERQAEEVAVKYKTIIAIISFVALVVISLIIILTINRKNRNLKKLMSMSNEVKSTRERLNDVNHQLEKVENELKNKEDLLSEKMQQNSSILRLLNKSKLEENAEEVVETIRQAAKGKKNLNAEEWKQLYAAVDKLYPEFRDQLIERLGNFSEKQMEVCYLMRIRLKNPEIQQLTGLSRATVWRWVKKFDWIK